MDTPAQVINSALSTAAHRAAHNIETLAVAIGHTPEAGDMEMMILSSLRHEIGIAADLIERK